MAPETLALTERKSRKIQTIRDFSRESDNFLKITQTNVSAVDVLRAKYGLTGKQDIYEKDVPRISETEKTNYLLYPQLRGMKFGV